MRVSVADLRIEGSSCSYYFDWRSCKRSLVSARIRLSHDTVGMWKLCGCHFTVSHIRVELVDGIHILWQR